MIRLAPRHGRFVSAFAVGVILAFVAWAFGVAPAYALLIGADAFFLLYLALMAWFLRSAGPEVLQRHAAQADEGVALILVLALMAVLVSILAIFLVLTAAQSGLPAHAMALLSLALGWATVHVLAAFHYANLYYRSPDRGMVFPGTEAPGAWDFLYASFTIGMTAQVSDVVIETRAMRQAVLVHGVASFFYNTCILALAVNAAVSAAL